MCLHAVALLEADEGPDLGLVVRRVPDDHLPGPSAKSSTTLSCADRSTRIRLRAQQSCPQLSKTLYGDSAAKRSRSASA